MPWSMVRLATQIFGLNTTQASEARSHALSVLFTHMFYVTSNDPNLSPLETITRNAPNVSHVANLFVEPN